MVVVNHINDNYLSTAMGDKVARALRGLPQQVCSAEDFALTGLESV